MVPLSFKYEIELLEPMILDVWDLDTIHSIQGDELDIELLLATYHSTMLMLVTEFIDFDDNMAPVSHAVAVKFDMTKGCWLLVDSNQEAPLALNEKNNVNELVQKASVIRVLEWVMV